MNEGGDYLDIDYKGDIIFDNELVGEVYSDYEWMDGWLVIFLT